MSYFKNKCTYVRYFTDSKNIENWNFIDNKDSSHDSWIDIKPVKKFDLFTSYFNPINDEYFTTSQRFK